MEKHLQKSEKISYIPCTQVFRYQHQIQPLIQCRKLTYISDPNVVSRLLTSSVPQVSAYVWIPRCIWLCSLLSHL
jgi:hypothetical protein